MSQQFRGKRAALMNVNSLSSSSSSEEEEEEEEDDDDNTPVVAQPVNMGQFRGKGARLGGPFAGKGASLAKYKAAASSESEEEHSEDNEEAKKAEAKRLQEEQEENRKREEKRRQEEDEQRRKNEEAARLQKEKEDKIKLAEDKKREEELRKNLEEKKKLGEEKKRQDEQKKSFEEEKRKFEEERKIFEEEKKKLQEERKAQQEQSILKDSSAKPGKKRGVSFESPKRKKAKGENIEATMSDIKSTIAKIPQVKAWAEKKNHTTDKIVQKILSYVEKIGSFIDQHHESHTKQEMWQWAAGIANYDKGGEAFQKIYDKLRSEQAFS